jgi:hypothetical protein
MTRIDQLNQYYPGGVLSQIGDALGGVTFDQYHPGGVIAQLRAAAGVETPPDQYDPGGAVRLLVDPVD